MRRIRLLYDDGSPDIRILSDCLLFSAPSDTKRSVSTWEIHEKWEGKKEGTKVAILHFRLSNTDEVDTAISDCLDKIQGKFSPKILPLSLPTKYA